ISRIAARCVSQDRMEASGTAWAAESSKPLPQIASNPASAASFAESGLCADMAMAGRSGVSIARRRAGASVMARCSLRHACGSTRARGGQGARLRLAAAAEMPEACRMSDTTPFDRVIRGDIVLTDRVLRDGYVAIRGETIAAIGEGVSPPAKEVVDHAGKY